MGDEQFNAENLEDRYEKQLAESHFSKLLCETPYLATWDNHDFGRNDVENLRHKLTDEQKEKSRALFDKYLKKGSLQPKNFLYKAKKNHSKK